MGTWVVLALALAADGRGAQPAVTAAQREATRLHAGLGVIGSVGLSGFALGFGPGLEVEVGLTLRDRTTLSVRGELGTVLMFATASLGLAVDFSVAERCSLGAGLALAYFGGLFATDLPEAVTALVPLRVTVALSTRSEAMVARRGFRLFLEAGPGGVLGGSRGYAPPNPAPLPRWAVTATVGVLYAW